MANVKNQTAVSASAPKPAKSSAKAGELRNISVEPAENGFSVRCRYEPNATKGQSYPSYEEPKEYVFETADAALAHVAAALGVKAESK